MFWVVWFFNRVYWWHAEGDWEVDRRMVNWTGPLPDGILSPKGILHYTTLHYGTVQYTDRVADINERGGIQRWDKLERERMRKRERQGLRQERERSQSQSGLGGCRCQATKHTQHPRGDNPYVRVSSRRIQLATKVIAPSRSRGTIVWPII